jgi:hypothetical protein
VSSNEPARSEPASRIRKATIARLEPRFGEPVGSSLTRGAPSAPGWCPRLVTCSSPRAGLSSLRENCISPEGGPISWDPPQEHEIHKLLGQVWVDSVARDEDAVEERGC